MIIGTYMNYVVMESETGQVSLIPLTFITSEETKELEEHLRLRSYPPQLEKED